MTYYIDGRHVSSPRLPFQYAARRLHRELHAAMGDTSMAQVARDTGISIGVLGKWSSEPEALAERWHETIRRWIKGRQA